MDSLKKIRRGQQPLPSCSDDEVPRTITVVSVRTDVRLRRESGLDELVITKTNKDFRDQMDYIYPGYI